MIAWQHLLLLALYVGVSVSGLTLMKLRTELTDTMTWVGFALYGAGFGLWLLFLKRVPLSKAFPVAAGCLIIATQLCGWYFLKESISRSQMLGIAMMLLAVPLIFRA
ncbi:SMR family transporter [Bosea massiliensis]|uniref:SMR family transporter n=1 Tax=Bosea massiliensis TaxID=151419 RepID=A0ABW0P930_9HYPH